MKTANRVAARARVGGWFAAAIATMGLVLSPSAEASPSGVVLSQVYGGGGNSGATLRNDFIELFNGGTAAVSISGWSVQYASAGGATWTLTTLPAYTLQPGQYFLVQQAAGTGGTQNLPTPDATGTLAMVGTAGKVSLVRRTSALTGATPTANVEDLVGYGATYFEGSAAAPGLSNTTAALRGVNGCTDTNQNGADFSAGAPSPRNTATPLAPCGGPPPSAAIVPLCPATLSVATGATVDFALSASDTDSIVNSATLQGAAVTGLSLTNFNAASADGGSAHVRLSLASNLTAGSHSVVVAFGNDDAQTTSCTIGLNVAAVSSTYTPIYTLQGSGASSTMTGTRTTRGVVTRVNNNGYFIQDAAGDGNPATSDGIFVFTSTAPSAVQIGHEVQITGTVTEFNTGAAGNAVTVANPVTEFTNLTGTVFTGTGSIAPTTIAFPIAAQGDLERYEGMLVRIESPLTASQNYFQGRYGQVTLSANGRLVKPTNIYRPGTALALSQQDLNARSSLMLDDGSSLQNPNPTPYIGTDNTLRAGDTLPTGITGVIDYGLATSDNTGLAMYRVHPTDSPAFVRSNPRTTTPPPVVGGNVKVASFNVLNYFTTFLDGTNAQGQTGQTCTQGSDTPSASLCRGANNLPEFLRQRAKIVEAMVAINADVVGLMEIQNNGNVAAQNLVDALNAVMGANTYAVAPTPPTTGTDAIRVAMIYKPSMVALSGSPMSDSNAIHNRPPFAQTFLVNGQRFGVVVNHFKSKGSCPASGADTDQGDGQGCFNQQRTQQATALLSFVNSVQSAGATSGVLVIGDLNAYGAEDPIHTLTTGGLVNEVARADAAGYSYVFDGEAGTLDHALATANLSSQVTGTVHWHINADEPSIIDYNLEFKQPACATCGPDYYSATAYRSSDHDPVVVGLSIAAAAAQTLSFTTPADRALSVGGFTVTATASSGLPVSFGSTTPSVCTVTPAGAVTLVAAGTCTLTADQSGNASYAAAPTVARSFAITVGSAQTIQFDPLVPRAIDSGTFSLVSTASSGLQVVFSSLTAGTCSVSGATVTLLAQGACSIAADQPGDANWEAAQRVTQTFNVTAPGTGVGGDADIPTLPEWAAILMAMTLLTVGAMRRNGRR